MPFFRIESLCSGHRRFGMIHCIAICLVANQPMIPVIDRVASR